LQLNLYRISLSNTQTPKNLKMKKVLLACCFLIGISAVSHAQGRQRRTPEEQATALKTSLSLTDDQTAKVTAILQASAKSQDSVRTASGGDRDAMRAKMMPMREATNAKIKAVLTADQAAAYQKQQDEMRARMQQGGGGGGGGTPPPSM
jgi:protein CpxP